MASKVRPVMKVKQNFSIFGDMYQVTDIVPYSDYTWQVAAEQLDSGKPAIFYIPTDYHTSTGTWKGNV